MADLLENVLDPAQKLRDEWAKKIEQYKRDFKKFEERGKKIVEKYRVEDSQTGDNVQRMKKLNIFWSNVQTLGPAIYSKAPKIQVVRRFFDKDPVARLASAILERAVSYELSVTDFHGEILKSRDDYLLVGRGTLWQRYEPIIESQTVEDPDEDDTGEDIPAQSTSEFNTPQPGVEAMGANGGPKLQEKVIGENAPADYVHWKDFLHGTAQNWKQVPWVGRRVLMDKASVDKRWPDEDDQGNKLSYYLSFTHKQQADSDKDKSQSSTGDGKLACIYEFWDKTKFKVLWYSPDLKTRVIEELDDPLGLVDFFPCPPPLYATMTTDRLVPIPDYILYEDQAESVNTLTQRMALLTKALAVRGMYDGSLGKLSDLLNERPENFMVPVDNWAAFAEKGGLQGATSFLPIQQVAETLMQLQNRRASEINDIYAVTGISDIIRGDSDPNETAAAQQIKSQYGNLRLNNRRDAVNSFLRDSIRIRAQVMCDHFDESTLRQISGFDQMTEVTSAVQTEGANADQMWQQSYSLLKNDPLRLTHIDIETDSTIEPDLQAEQKNRVEFLQAVGGFLQQAMAALQQMPQMLPLLGQMFLWGIRGFKIGRELESSFEAAIDQMMQQAKQQQSQPRPPSPEEIKAQTDAQRIEVDKQRASTEAVRASTEAQQVASETNDAKKQFAQALYEFEENIKLQREELMLKYGINPFIQAAIAAKDEDAENAETQLGMGSQPAQTGP